MGKVLWASLAAAIHAGLFGLMWGVYWTQPEPLYNRPAAKSKDPLQLRREHRPQKAFSQSRLR